MLVRSLAVAFIFFGSICGSWAQTPPSQHNDQSMIATAHTLPVGSRTRLIPQSNDGRAEQEIQGGYWRIDHTFEPMLIITNILESPLPVRPSIYAADGTEYELPTLTLASAGVAYIDIRQSISTAPEEIRLHFSDHGSVGLKYLWQWPGAVSAIVQNRDVKRSLNFNFELRTATNASDTISVVEKEGLWWKQDEGVRGFLGLTNTSQRVVDVQVRIVSKHGGAEDKKVLSIQPHHTQVVDLVHDSRADVGGLRVSYSGTGKDIVLAGGLENAREGYSARIPFNTVERGQNPATIEVSSVGFMLGAPDPMMKFPSGTQFGGYLALRNIAERPILIIPMLYYMDGEQVRKNPLRPVVLAAQEARFLDPGDFSKELGLPAFSGVVSLVFSYQGNASDIIIANGSIDQTKTYVSEVEPRTVGNTEAIVLKDWDVSNGNDTMINLLNVEENERDLSVIFFFDGGRYKFPVHLDSGASIMFNISEVIARQEPDVDGHKIPLGTLHGTAVLSGASGYPEWINVGVSVGVFNVSTATCGNKCPTCFGYSAFKVQALNSNAATGGTASFEALAFGQNGVWQNVSNATSPTGSAIVTWSSGNSSVATSQGNGNFLGVNPGGFNANANAVLLDLHADCPVGQNQPCPSSPYVGSGGGTIQKPAFLQLTSTTTGGATGCPTSCSTLLQYRVLDSNGNPIPAAMTIKETVSNHGSSCKINITDAGTWATDSTGTMIGSDEMAMCCPPGLTCGVSLIQTFTVNGYGVLLMAQPPSPLTGSHNNITNNCSNGTEGCAKVVISP